MGFTYAFGVFFAQEHPYYYTPAVFFLFVFMSSSFVNFGIGYIDAHLSTEVRMECDGKSKKDLLAHATTFMILQYLIIPVIAVLVVIVMLVNFLYRMLQSN